MSRGKSTPSAWRGAGPRPVVVRQDQKADERRMVHARANAVTVGWCHACGVVVLADGLHASDCPIVDEERRRCAP